MLTFENLEERREQLRRERDRLQARIHRMTALLRAREQRTKKKQAARAEKIYRSIESLGGAEQFIRNFGNGQVLETPPRYGAENCSDFSGPQALFREESRLLGTRPAVFSRYCEFRGRYLYEGKRYCRIHLRFVLSRSDTYRNRVNGELLDQFRIATEGASPGAAEGER